MNQHEDHGFGNDYRARFNEMCMVARIASFPITIWTTRFGTWGHRYLTGFALLGMIWLVVFAAFSEQDPRVGELNLFLVLSIGLLLVHRVAGPRPEVGITGAGLFLTLAFGCLVWTLARRSEASWWTLAAGLWIAAASPFAFFWARQGWDNPLLAGFVAPSRIPAA